MHKTLLNTLSGRFARLGLVATSLMCSASMAMAQNSMGDIATRLRTQTGLLTEFVSVVAFILGVGMAIAGFLKFKQNAQNPNDPSAKVSTAFILIFVGAGLVAIPAALGTGIATIWQGAQQTDANSGFRAVGN
ncbi:hypothetical protein IQ03_01246 [Gemmobacter caeni]|uniref:TrbC/VIRB2 family protein n=1 Tax=Gemmobacter caeni TaxID=589035 RepID=A0A2T6B8U3_9RHOB|nr:hypothetical protein [Gemmobacter caeni]PTX52501.1 hypothetical protein C8N34_102281 [Gemmobacter caeni]TWJ02828.1 hypothetical protein IQ03_01246 [Gemmobacter caeni]